MATSLLSKAIGCTLALLPLTADAQTYKDHVTEELAGPVKSVTYNINGVMLTTVSYADDGKSLNENDSDRTYDKDGYLTRCKTTLMGHIGTTHYTYDKQKRVTACKWEAAGGYTLTTFSYDKGIFPTSSTLSICCDGEVQELKTTFCDYVTDRHGNWVTRSCIVGNESFTDTRTIIYP